MSKDGCVDGSPGVSYMARPSYASWGTKLIFLDLPLTTGMARYPGPRGPFGRTHMSCSLSDHSISPNEFTWKHSHRSCRNTYDLICNRSFCNPSQKRVAWKYTSS